MIPSLFLSERVKLFHVDEICMGIKSILMYSPGLTCQKKVHIGNHKNLQFFSTFSAPVRRFLLRLCLSAFLWFSLSVCPLFSVSTPNSAMKDRFFVCYLTLHWFMNKPRRRVKLKIKVEGELRRICEMIRASVRPDAVWEEWVFLILCCIIFTTQWAPWTRLYQIKSWQKGILCKCACVYHRCVFIRMCVCLCVHIFIT